jgi:hypothetical protein
MLFAARHEYYTLAGINNVMKKILLPFLCFTLLTLTAFAADWPRQEITKAISFGFPAKARITTAFDQVNYLYSADTCSYLVQTKPYKEGGKVNDSTTLEAFYNGVAKGIIKGAKATLVHKNDMYVNGLRGIELEYVKGDQFSHPVTVGTRILLVDDLLLVYSFTAPSQSYAAMHSLEEQFLSSITIAKDSVATQYHPMTAADSIAVSTIRPGAVPAISDTSHAAYAPHNFWGTHAGSVFRMFGVLILIFALIYFFATLSRRKE